MGTLPSLFTVTVKVFVMVAGMYGFCAVTVNKVPSLRDFARRSGERNNLAVFIDFIVFI
jgi:hypothetical protein